MPTHPSRRHLLTGLAAGGALGLGGAARGARKGKEGAAAKTRPNVLFISIDDLNDWVGILGGHPQADTPNIDRLAAMGVSFDNAHAPAPACNPSRTAILTGLAPSSTGVYGNHAPFRSALPDRKTLPQWFRAAGYRATGAGKMFHRGDPESWDRYWPDGCAWPQELKSRTTPTRKDAEAHMVAKGYPSGPGRRQREGAYPDATVARIVSRELRKTHDQPFFLACGFFRPHLPWYVPEDFFAKYPLEGIALPEVNKADLDDVPAAGRRLARLEDHERIVQAGGWKKAVQGYLASLSFADAMLGEVLDALEEGPNKADTIVVMWSDHGWSLGTKFHWKKFALWEECTRVPLVIRVPGDQARGQVCSRPVSLQDLFPTLCELCGLDLPNRVDGHSLVPLVRDPGAAWSHVALTTQSRGNHAVRDARYRYIRYGDGSEELYDHRDDPHEWRNRARDGDLAEVKAELRARLPREEARPVPDGAHACKGDRE